MQQKNVNWLGISLVLVMAIILVALLLVLFILFERQSRIVAVQITATGTSTATATIIPTSTLTPTITPTDTPYPTASQTDTPAPTFTESPTSTITDTPTDTPSPTVETQTFTPGPTSTNYPVIVQVVASVAVFRTGPGRVYPTITQVYKGSKIQLSGISQDRQWYEFPYAQNDAWISGSQQIVVVIMGDINELPVIAAPPTPTAGAPDLSGADAPNCDLYASLGAVRQNDLLKQVYAAVDADDWQMAGQIARGLYRCSMAGTFYLLYDVYMPSVRPAGSLVVQRDAALSLFSKGWMGQ